MGSFWDQCEARLVWPQGEEPGHCCAPAQAASECSPLPTTGQAEGWREAVEVHRYPVPETGPPVYPSSGPGLLLVQPAQTALGLKNHLSLLFQGLKLCSCCHRTLACPTIQVSWPTSSVFSRTAVTKKPKYKSVQFLPHVLYFLILLEQTSLSDSRSMVLPTDR